MFSHIFKHTLEQKSNRINAVFAKNETNLAYRENLSTQHVAKLPHHSSIFKMHYINLRCIIQNHFAKQTVH